MAENYTPVNVSTFTNDTTAVNTVNNNFSAISSVLTDVLSRSGVSPNQMTSTLDMNSNQIINLPPPASTSSPARLIDVAGNPTITVPPVGTSGAVVPLLNTANTWSNTQTFTLPSNNAQGILVSASTNGATAQNPYIYNSFSVSDNLSGPGVDVTLNSYMGVNGSNVNNSRQAFQSTLQLLNPTSPSNTARFYVSGVFAAEAVSNDGGTLGSEKGQLFCLGPVLTLDAAATHMAAAINTEFDINCKAGSSTLIKYGVLITQLSTDAVSGSQQDSALCFTNQIGAVGWGTLIQIGDGVNQNPLKSTGTILTTKGSPTLQTGIDISGATLSGNAFKSPGFNVGGTGLLTLGMLTSGGSITFNGSTSGSSILSVNSTGNTLTTSQNFTTTGALTTNNHLITIGSGIATPTPTLFGGTSGSIGFGTPSAIFNPSGTFTLTLPAASGFPGFWYYFKNISANAVNSASSNVVPIGTNTAGTAIIAASAGKFVFLQSDGTNWITMAGN